MNNNKRQVALKMGHIFGETLGFYETDKIMTKLKSLAKAHHKQCENACNGEGYIKGKYYSCGTADGKSAYPSYDHDQTVFDIEIQRIENAIELLFCKLVEHNRPHHYVLHEFQHDPRGATVKMTLEGHTFCPAWDF